MDAIVCAHAVEAAVHELRLIAAHRPRYNRRSRNPHATWWVTTTAEPFPRLSVVSTPREGALGPFRSQRDAREAVDTVLDAVPLRPCTLRIPARGAAAGPCALYELHRCAAPCAGHQDVEGYAPAVAAWRELVDGADDGPLHVLADEVSTLSAGERFEAAARRRDRLAGLVGALGRGQQLTALAGLAEVVGARPDGSGGWDLVVVRHGRLAAAGVARRGVPPMPVVDALRAGAATLLPGPGPLRGAAAEEVRLLHRWLTGGGTRLGPLQPAVGGTGARRRELGCVGAPRPAGGGGRGRSGHRPTLQSVVITAIVLVHVAADRIPEAAQAIADLDGVDEVYSCAGDVDLIAIVKVTRHEELADVIAGRLSKVDGVRRTDTHIAFRSWSRADTEATFDVGLDS